MSVHCSEMMNNTWVVVRACIQRQRLHAPECRVLYPRCPWPQLNSVATPTEVCRFNTP
jgi:hypothetical protein